ncbi:MAG: 2-dehydropantoate 2-reductase, partial [Hydrogenobacter sp.]
PGKDLKSIRVEGIWGEFEQNVRVIDDVSLIPYRPNVIIICVKSYDTENALRSVSKLVKEGSYILIAQNGYGNYERAVELFGKDRVILSRVIFGAKLSELGSVKVTVCADDVVLGSPSGSVEEAFLKDLAQALRKAGIPTRYEREVYKYLWEKIIYNCALNPLGALFSATYGQLAENPHTREIIDGIIDEIFEVLTVSNIQTFHASSQRYKEHFYSKLLPPTAEHYPSMLEDLKRGRTEIDTLNGAIVKLAFKVGIKAPINQVITDMIKARESLR